MDEIDYQIIMALQYDGKSSMTKIGKEISLSQPAITERVKRLEEQGVIEGYQAIIDQGKVNKPISAFLLFQARHCNDFVAYCETVEDVLEIHRISGHYNFLVKVIAETLEALEQKINDLGRHGDSTTLVVLSTPMKNRPIFPKIAGVQT
ncbi:MULTISPECIES: Lrp/AsnC family transcriptional regulator [unclassified Bacillus (in: firmicutes)]|uniref:Lrp/AsnC family transcriptional regulator n=1 Tax=unclassified Bacillus (in: firmicutes) TaxID=185979 RepID=UPI001BE6E1B8|nr:MULTISPECIES: Lrp/AsnC family transcriptional regulator [unclassified Bacillus (in: firmicutes)]MBT2619115.1 Lrp/AsnC family transcriptional regulator [Bacillus sp. ISL-78]MBT2632658.1 Lrp/AsnC family transcriptional regulator [Bacillus sp. ISL-101]MBT2717246.1 Lrp/AsnC family transcriptional regulator [Bacillus sp. ISL-57]